MQKEFWKYYKITKQYSYASYDVLSVVVILLSLDRIYKMRSLKGIKAWQIARLVERFPKMVKTFKKF